MPMTGLLSNLHGASTDASGSWPLHKKCSTARIFLRNRGALVTRVRVNAQPAQSELFCSRGAATAARA